MRWLFITILFYPLLLSAQLITRPLSSPSTTNARVSGTEEDPVLSLPFWEDFSTSSFVPDTSKWKFGENIYVNETLGKNAPTYKVATFDGQNGLGQAYNQEVSFPGPADSLITHAIDLSQVSNFNKNTVFLSFFWQAFGNGELPDEDDSIRVQFLTIDSLWVTAWVINGGLENSHEHFRQEIIQVSDDRFFHNNFRIKFQAFINRGGPFDTFHIDYIYLNEARNINDTLHFDRALSGSGALLFSPYHEIPAHQFFVDPFKYLTSQYLSANNMDNTPHPLDYYYRLTNLTDGTVYLDTAMGNAGRGAMQPLEYRTIEGPEILNFPVNSLDSQVIESRFYYRTGDKFLFEEVDNGDTLFLPVNLAVNDTIRYRYTLHQHYAYDDGTAEYAAGINLLRGKLAVQFMIDEPDTLTHIDIHIPDIVPNPNGKSIDLMVWNTLSENGILRQQSYPIVVSGKNQFNRIKLNTPIIVSDTFYIGYQQFTDNFIGIGFDRNNPVSGQYIYYQTSAQWEQNDRIEGAMMIRPVFQDNSQYVLSLPERDVQLELYPNPTNGVVYSNQPFDQLHVYSLSGQHIFSSGYQPEINLSELRNGIYLVKIQVGDQFFTRKVIINH